MIFIYASMLEFIIVNYLHRKTHHGHHHHHQSSSSSRPQSSEAPSHSLHPSSHHHHMDHLRPNLTSSVKEDLEVRAPLVVGEDPGATFPVSSIISSPPEATQATLRQTSSVSNINHRQLELQETRQSPRPEQLRPQSRPLTPILGTGGGMSPSPSPRPTIPGDERMRAAASVFAWLRRPNIFQPQQEVTSQARLARSIDHVSKTVFPFLYGVFSFTFFAVFAGYLPSLLDEWIANEYRDE